MNPNNAAYHAAMDNRSNQLNPNNDAYWSSRAGSLAGGGGAEQVASASGQVREAAQSPTAPTDSFPSGQRGGSFDTPASSSASAASGGVASAAAGIARWTPRVAGTVLAGVAGMWLAMVALVRSRARARGAR